MPPTPRKSSHLSTLWRATTMTIALLLAFIWWQTNPLDRAISLTYNTTDSNVLGLFASNGQLTPFWAASIADTTHLAQITLHTSSTPPTFATIFAQCAADPKGITDGIGANYHACGFGLIWLHDWSLPHSTVIRISGPARALNLPFWFIESLLLLPLLPPLWQKYKSHHRTAANLCPNCNYDLCASPITCPECGTPKTPPLHP